MSVATQGSATQTMGLQLEPIDLLFFRDGRPFTAATRGYSRLPTPQTLAGAIRTLLLRQTGCDFQALGQAAQDGQPLASAIECAGGPRWVASVQVRGPWLARKQNDQGEFEVLVPTPSALLTEKTASRGATPRLFRLDPLSPQAALPGWSPPLPDMRPLWLPESVVTERVGGFLRPEGLKQYLQGRAPEPVQIVSAGELYDYDHRTGIAVEPERLTAQEGYIYAASFLSLKPGVSLYAEINWPEEAPHDDLLDGAALPFGGEGRRVCVKTTPPFRWPSVKPKDDQKALLALITPRLFARGWRPRSLERPGKLVAAAVSGHLPVSGWDLARGGPKPTRFAAPAGSVYFLDSPADEFSEEPLSDDAEDRLQGWGCYVKGAWSYA